MPRRCTPIEGHDSPSSKEQGLVEVKSWEYYLDSVSTHILNIYSGTHLTNYTNRTLGRNNLELFVTFN